ncbi:MAG TPA: NHLP bacteriocin export ABC transporter permease/ATPase subunit [Azospirillum sp.]|nr:NHLP bacteriocin export ABC transporter permease/ATPase subunit [Azospirillum sp.]
MSGAIPVSRAAGAAPGATATLPIDRLAQMGERTALTGAWTLGRSGWLIAKGGVEVFAAPAEGPGDAAEARRHVCTLTAGTLIPPLPDGPGEARLVAVPWAETEAVRYDADGLAAAGADPIAALALANGLDAWIGRFGDGIAGLVAHRPRPTVLAVPGRRLALPAGALVAGRQRVAWLTLPAGGMLAGLEPVSGAVPVTAGLWVEVDAAAETMPAATLFALRTTAFREVLAAFHAAAMAVLSVNLSLALVDEHALVEARARRQAHDLREVLGDLAGLVGGRTADAPVDARGGEFLFAAVAAVGKAMALPVVRPPKIRAADADVPPTLEEVAQASGFGHRRIALEGDWWRRDHGPLLAFTAEGRRPVALLPRGGWRSGYRIHDPADGRTRPLDRRAAAGLARYAHVLYKPLPDKTMTVAGLLGFGFRQGGADAASLLLLSLMGALLGTLPPVLTGFAIDTVVPGRATDRLLEMGVALTLAAIVKLTVDLAGRVAAIRVDTRAGGRLQAALWDRVIRLPLPFLTRHAAGDLAARVGVLEAFAASVRQLATGGAVAGATLLSSLGLLFLYDLRVALAACALMALLIAVTVATGWLQNRAMGDGEQKAGLVNAFVHEVVGGIQKIRLAAAETRAFVGWARRFAPMRSRMLRARRIADLHTAFLAGYQVLCLAAMFAVVALPREQAMSTGTFLAVVVTFVGAGAAAAQLAQLIMASLFLAPGLTYGRTLLDAVPERRAGKVDPGLLSGAIEVSNLGFRYDGGYGGGGSVFAGLSFTVEPGEFVAVVGPSGCGKSTLVRLLLGLEVPQAGAIFYDGRDLRGLNPQAVRRRIGTVLQQGRPMAGSILENIRGTSASTVEEAWEAATVAGLADDIRRMPMGMQTMVTDGGGTLSGGQVQRLMIARAVAGKPSILILDEATSALDNRIQADVMKRLEALSATRIVIAHRLSTIVNADRILVLEQGRVVQSGPYKRLIAEDGPFARLAGRQIA